MLRRSELPLFRSKALEARRPSAFGHVILVRPVPFSVLTMMTAALGAAIVGFFAFASFTRHTTLTGQLVPDRGLIEIHATQIGTIVEAPAAEGTFVERNEPLFVISSERFSVSEGALHDSIGRRLDAEERSLLAQRARLRALADAKTDALDRMIAALEGEEEALLGMLNAQRERLALAAEAVVRYQGIRDEGFVAEEHLSAKQGEALEHRSRLRSLERELNVVRRQLAELQSRATSTPLEHENQIADLDRAIAATRRQLSENEARRLVVVRAPESGLVTAVLGEVGQAVDPGRPLAWIVPADSRLEAHLYAPSRAVGFIAPGDRVLVRFDAYPYQRFGHHEGTVEAVSRTAAPAAELIGHTAGGSAPMEPLYRITVALPVQSITAYGRRHTLQPGMTLQADVLQDTRRLYEWVLEPLYTLTGKMH